MRRACSASQFAFYLRPLTWRLGEQALHARLIRGLRIAASLCPQLQGLNPSPFTLYPLPFTLRPLPVLLKIKIEFI
jgi:hypothetical protein